jgi:hypothetical protein
MLPILTQMANSSIRKQPSKKRPPMNGDGFCMTMSKKEKLLRPTVLIICSLLLPEIVLVDIQLKQEDGYVLVELTQKNIPTDENSKRNIRLGCHTGWSFYLVNLKSVYEGGLDLRNKNENTYPMVNN